MSNKCPECDGATVQFRGNTVDSSEYRICTRYRESGHLSEDEIKGRIAGERERIRPSGRFA